MISSLDTTTLWRTEFFSIHVQLHIMHMAFKFFGQLQPSNT